MVMLEKPYHVPSAVNLKQKYGERKSSDVVKLQIKGVWIKQDQLHRTRQIIKHMECFEKNFIAEPNLFHK